MVIYRKIRETNGSDLKGVGRVRDARIVANVAALITRPRRTPREWPR
jgi:DNA polymerase/3'-5' exonuclease PolX